MDDDDDDDDKKKFHVYNNINSGRSSYVFVQPRCDRFVYLSSRSFSVSFFFRFDL